MITVKVKLFAAYQEAYQLPEIELSFPENTAAIAVLNQVMQEHPSLEVWRGVTRLGVNYQFVDPQTPLQTGDEVVLIPPVSGGVSRNRSS